MMTASSSWFWVLLMFFCLAPPVAYCWRYRGWGPPYPRYIQRRRHSRAETVGGVLPFNHHAWGWGGDVVWVLVLLGAVWALSILSWH
jgi:hypothetical protein